MNKKIILNIFFLVCLIFGIYFQYKIMIHHSNSQEMLRDLDFGIQSVFNIIFLLIAPIAILLKDNLPKVDFVFTKKAKFIILLIFIILVLIIKTIISKL